MHYYFDTRADLLMQAFDHADVKADEAADGGAGRASRARSTGCERLLLIYAGADAVFRDDWVLWVEMWRSAIFDERLAESVRRSSDGWIEQISDLIERGPGRGLAARATSTSTTPRVRLAAVVDGLGLQILSGVLTHERAAELIQGALTLELGIPAKARSGA